MHLKVWLLLISLYISRTFVFAGGIEADCRFAAYGFVTFYLYEIEILSRSINHHYNKACHKQFVCLLACFQAGEVRR